MQLTTDQLLDLYKVAIEEYRFQVRLNNDRLLHLTVFNIAVLSAGAGLLKIGGSRAGDFLIAAVFIAGFFISIIGAFAVGTLHRYYRRTIHRKTVYEEILGLTQAHELPSGRRVSLAIGTTDSQAEHHQILNETDAWLSRPLGTFSVAGGFRLTLGILAVLNILGAGTAIALALGFDPVPGVGSI